MSIHMRACVLRKLLLQEIKQADCGSMKTKFANYMISQLRETGFTK